LAETFTTLLVVCALAFVVLWGARRLGVGGQLGAAQLVGRLPLDARRAIYLVKVGPKVLVVGASEAGLTKLGEMAATELPPEPTRPASPFAALLARSMGSKAGPTDPPTKDVPKRDENEPRAEAKSVDEE
jgi:flagellar protein FliO/FliZ